MILDEVKVMDMSFDVRKVFQERLASSMGLDKYRYIMEQVSITNVAVDTDFQRTFNGFYVVRRNESWRKSYYEYFESVKNGKPTFKNIITYLYECTGNIEPSFSSKMLATIIPEKPIWDRYVVQNLNIECFFIDDGRIEVIAKIVLVAHDSFCTGVEEVKASFLCCIGK